MTLRKMSLFIVLATAIGVADETDGAAELKVNLKPMAANEKARLGYSSARRVEVEAATPRFLIEIPEFNAKDPLYFRIALGETEGIPFYGALDKSPGAVYHDLLYLDKDRDLDLTNDGKPIEARIRTLWTTEGKIIEFLNLKLDLPYKTDGKEKTAPYACVFFFALDKGKTAPEWMAVERDGWREGTVTVAGASYVLAMVDDDSDGQFSTGDSWVMRPLATDPMELLSRDATRSMLFPSWSTDQKWTVEVKDVSTDGAMATLRVKTAKEDERAYFTRIARQQQTAEEKRLKLDPLRPKADGNDKVDWIVGKDYAYALEIAKNPRVRKPILLAFDSKTCPHCRNMAKYTFRDREVVNLSKKFVCAKITFKAGTPDVTKFGVKGTPSYVLVGLNGAVKATSAGFKRPAEFAAWLKAALR